jgi:outer membrane protein assembly factor BamB
MDRTQPHHDRMKRESMKPPTTGRQRLSARLGAMAGMLLLTLLVAGCGSMPLPSLASQHTPASADANATAVNVANVYNLGGRIQQISVDASAHLLYALVFTGPQISIGPLRMLPIYTQPQVVAVDTQSGQILWRQPTQPLPAPGTPGVPPDRIAGIAANTANHTVAVAYLQDVRIFKGQSGILLSRNPLPGDFMPGQNPPVIDTTRNLLYLSGTVTDGPHPYTAALLAWNLATGAPAYRLISPGCGNAIFVPVPAQDRIYLALTPIPACPQGTGNAIGNATAHTVPATVQPLPCTGPASDQSRIHTGHPTTVQLCSVAAISASTAAPAPAISPGQSSPPQVQAYSADTGKLVASWTLPPDETPWGAISNAGVLLVVSPAAGTASTEALYDLATRQIIAILPHIAIALDANPAREHLYTVDQTNFTVRALHNGTALATLPIPGMGTALAISADGTVYLARTDGEALALADDTGQPMQVTPTQYWAAVMALNAVLNHINSQNQSTSQSSFSPYIPAFPIAPGIYRTTLCYGQPQPLASGPGLPAPTQPGIATYMTAIASQGNGAYQVTFTFSWTQLSPAVGAPRPLPGRHIWVVDITADGSSRITQDSGTSSPATCSPNIYNGPASPSSPPQG